MMRTMWRFILVAAVLLYGLAWPPYGLRAADPKMSKRSDAEVVKALASRDHVEAAGAEAEVIKRGERMIPALLMHKGDRRPYRGGGLGVRKSSGWAFVIPKEGETLKASDPPGLPVEVASLYLISRIYYGNFAFATAPALRYRGMSGEESKVINNSPDMVRRVHALYEEWVRKTTVVGIGVLRRQNEAPLSGTAFSWW